jgi:hypothetical protein
MVGGSTNKLMTAGFDQADKKANTFNAAKFSLVSNNSAEVQPSGQEGEHFQ